MASSESGLFSKCQRCRERPATIECVMCGYGESLQLCYDCDTKIHQNYYKQSHKRSILTPAARTPISGSMTGRGAPDREILGASTARPSSRYGEERNYRTYRDPNSSISSKREPVSVLEGVRRADEYSAKEQLRNKEIERMKQQNREKELSLRQDLERTREMTQNKMKYDIKIHSPHQATHIPSPMRNNFLTQHSATADSRLFETSRSTLHESQLQSKIKSPIVVHSRIESNPTEPVRIPEFPSKTERFNASKYLDNEISAEKKTSKTNEGLFSKDYIQELKDFYRRERDNYEKRIIELENANKETKKNLMEQISSLRIELEQRTKRHSEQLDILASEQNTKLQQIIDDKDHLIQTLQKKVYALKEQVDDEGRKLGDARSQLTNLKMEYNHEVGECKNRLEIIQEQNAQLKSDHQRHLRENMERYENDKTILKADYEKLYMEMKEDHERKRNDLYYRIEEKDKEITSLKREVLDLRSAYNVKAETLKKEIELLQDNLKSVKKLNELQTADSNLLTKKFSQAQEELKIKSKEIKLLEGENLRIIAENDDMRGKLNKMDKMVYGKSKSRSNYRK